MFFHNILKLPPGIAHLSRQSVCYIGLGDKYNMIGLHMLANKLILIISLGLSLAQHNLMAASCVGRSIYLNGIDISGSQNQDLRKVDILINEKGDIYITAPQYEVYEEDHYLPLSTFLRSHNNPEHRTLQQLRHNQDMGLKAHEKREDIPSTPSSEIPRASTLKGLNQQASELTIPPPPNTQSDLIPPKLGDQPPTQ